MIMINKRIKKTMMRQLKSWGIIVLVFITFVVYAIESKTDYTYVVYEVDGGYGYHIEKSDKVIIRQDFIPAKNGYQPFVYKAHAVKAAKIVVRKLQNKQVPALSSKEVENIIH